MPMCAVAQCSSTASRYSGLRFHVVPRAEPERSLWFERIGRKDKGDQCLRVCSEHFNDSDYERNLGVMRSLGLATKNVRLKAGALPTLRLPAPSHTAPKRVKIEGRGSQAALFDTCNPDWSPTLHLGHDKGKVKTYVGHDKGKAKTSVIHCKRLKPRESNTAPEQRPPESEWCFVWLVSRDAVDEAPIVKDCTTNISGTTTQGVQSNTEEHPQESESKSILPDFPISQEAETSEGSSALGGMHFQESGCQTELTAANIDELEKQVLLLNAEICAARTMIERIEVPLEPAKNDNHQSLEPDEAGDCLGGESQQRYHCYVKPVTWDAAVQVSQSYSNAATQVRSLQLGYSCSVGTQVNLSVKDTTSCAAQTDPATCDNGTDEGTVATVSCRARRSASSTLPLKRYPSRLIFLRDRSLKDENVID